MAINKCHLVPGHVYKGKGGKGAADQMRLCPVFFTDESIGFAVAIVRARVCGYVLFT